MRIKKVSRYWCDHCNKAGLQKRGMTTHEQHCTMNPERSCRVCRLLEESSGDLASAPLSELLSILPEYVPLAFDPNGEIKKAHVDFEENLKKSIPKLRAATNGCPACFLAALRQKKIPVPYIKDFDFKKEMAQIFSDMNDFRSEQGGY